MSAEDATKLKSIRGAYKGHCTQDIKRAERIIDNTEQPDHTELKAVMERLDRRSDEIARMDGVIVMSLETQEDIEKETEDALSFHDKISYWKLKISDFLQDKKQIPVSPFHFTSLREPKSHINLPKINIKTFGGNPLEWTTFWDSFSATIDENTDLSNIEKMNYLSGMLKEEAARAISGLQLSSDNYNKAVELLKERFGRTQILINAYMESLSKIRAPSIETKGLRTFYDTCESYIRGLEALGIMTDSYGSLLIPILFKKIPTEIRCLILRANPLADSLLDELRSALRQEIETRERSYLTSTANPPSTSDETLVPTAGALLAGARQKTQMANNKPRTQNCVYCEGVHRPQNCDKFKTLSDRLAVLSRLRVCYNCLRANHMKSQCFSRGRCMNCRKKHHTSICDQTKESTQGTTKQEKEDSSKIIATQNQAHIGATHALHSKDNILMQSALVTVNGENIKCQGRILFDTGSQRTFITQDLKDKLELKILRKELLDITTFGAHKSTRQSFEVVAFTLSTDQEDIKVIALVTPAICPSLPVRMKHLPIPHELEGLKFADPLHAVDDLTIDIIIGNDHYGQLITGTIRKFNNEALIAMQSKFGWLLSGPLPKENTGSNHDLNTSLCQRVEVKPVEDKKLDNLLTKFWEITTIPEDNKNDETVLKTFQESVKFNEATGRYNVKLPWKDHQQDLPTNLSLSKRRLNSLQHSLNKKDPELIVKYNKQLLEQLNLGFIEKVTDLNTHEGTLHYIPHFPVFKTESATTKMRIVYDASARLSPKTLSLNECLHTGPNLMQDLSGILLKFRTHRMAFTADIEKAFLQIELNQEDRDATRFLWLKDIRKSVNDTNNLEAYRFCRVLFGAAPSPFLLTATIQHHLNQKNDWVAKDLKDTMYMDNVLSGTSNESRALQYYTLSRNYLQEAGMNLRQWTSNSVCLNQKAKEHGTGATSTVKVLGLTWNSTTDTLSLSLGKMIEATENIAKTTKRSVLSIASQLFDPLGFTEPYTVKAKIMMQELWKHDLNWDENISDDHKDQWLKWFSEIKDLTSIEIPRPYFLTDITKTQLHVFCDSSTVAYGAVAYLRGTSENGTYTTFVMARSKVAPVKTQTLPRLELLAALLGAKLSEYLNKILNTEIDGYEIIHWCDSQIVISWLLSNKKLPQFIHTRVRQIKELTSSCAWRYCPTSANPADLLTRGVNIKTFLDKKNFWFNGPSWLKEPVDKWPTNPKEKAVQDEDVEDQQMEITNLAKIEENVNVLNVIDIRKYSTLNRAVSITARLIHYIRKCRKLKVGNTLTSENMLEARNLLLKATQQITYGQELVHLENNVRTKQPAIIQQLGLYIDDDGLIRCRGRLQYTDLPDKTKFPILIPKQSYLTTLIVRAMHIVVMHGGVRETLTQIRQTYWIPQGRQLAKRIISKCVTCRKAEGPPFRSVATPPLPKSRVTGSHAFQVTGVDYAGPLYVRGPGNLPASKMYICLFTCAAVRALHLELVEDQTTQAFLRAFRRFASRRGVPQRIISDNAKNFKAGSLELKAMKTQILEAAASQKFLTNHGISWNFITERAPWWGGFYERLVGLVKRCLKKTIGKACLNMIELNTILTEVEAVLNSRPLTYPYVEINDAPPLTPSHFLCGHRLMTLPDSQAKPMEVDPDYTPNETTTKELTKRARYHERVMKTFWTRWQEEYLTSLREHHSSRRNRVSRSVSIRDVVVIHDNVPRSQWKLGVITRLHQGKDGLVRSVSLRTSSGKELSRPIEKLYPLEMSEDSDKDSTDNNVDKAPVMNEQQRPPVRLAAQKAAQRIKELSE